MQIECAPRERILYAALRAGVGVPHECATGSCGTCKARARPGTVEDVWPQAPGHAYLKRERGDDRFAADAGAGARLGPIVRNEAAAPALPTGGTTLDARRSARP